MRFKGHSRIQLETFTDLTLLLFTSASLLSYCLLSGRTQHWHWHWLLSWQMCWTGFKIKCKYSLGETISCCVLLLFEYVSLVQDSTIITFSNFKLSIWYFLRWKLSINHIHNHHTCPYTHNMMWFTYCSIAILYCFMSELKKYGNCAEFMYKPAASCWVLLNPSDYFWRLSSLNHLSSCLTSICLLRC